MVPPGAMELVRGTSCKRGTNKKIKIKKCTSAYYVILVLDIPTQYYYMYQVPSLNQVRRVHYSAGNIPGEIEFSYPVLHPEFFPPGFMK